MPFCPNCGKEVSEDMEFCPECGQRLKQGFTLEERNKYIEEFKASVEGGKPPKKTEITLRVFPIDVRGIWIYHYYDMYFTNKRIVANAVGQGENARATTMATSVFPLPVLLERMYEKKGPFSDAEQILKADKKNFAWDYESDIISIEFKRKTGWWGGPPAMMIRLAQGEKKFCVFRKEHFEDLKSLLQKVAGEKLVPK